VTKKIKIFEDKNVPDQSEKNFQSFEDVYKENEQFLKKNNISITYISLTDMENYNMKILGLINNNLEETYC